MANGFGDKKMYYLVGINATDNGFIRYITIIEYSQLYKETNSMEAGNKSNIIVRKATFEDLDSIYDFLCDLEEEEFNKKVFNDAYYFNLANPNNIYLISEFENEVVGYLSFNSRMLLHHGGQKVGEILEMYVVPEKRSLGIGKMLLDKIKSLSKVLNIKFLELSSNKKRVESHKFYIREGFEETHKKFVLNLD